MVVLSAGGFSDGVVSLTLSVVVILMEASVEETAMDVEAPVVLLTVGPRVDVVAVVSSVVQTGWCTVVILSKVAMLEVVNAGCVDDGDVVSMVVTFSVFVIVDEMLVISVKVGTADNGLVVEE